MGCLPAVPADGPEVNRPCGASSLTLLLFLAFNADARPRYRVQTVRRDLGLAIGADTVSSGVDPVNCFFDGAQQFRIGLFQRKTNVQVAFLAGVVDPIAALRPGINRRSAGRR